MELYWLQFSNLFLYCYNFSAILLLIFTLVLKSKYREESWNGLHVLNSTIPWIYLIGLLIYVKDLFMAWYGQNAYEWYAFSENSSPYHWKYFWAIFLCTNIIALLFFIRKLRINSMYILLFLLLQNWERTTILITSLFRDYLPSAWATHYSETFNEQIIKWISFLIFFIVIYLITWKRKKLPFPSLFLKK